MCEKYDLLGKDAIKAEDLQVLFGTTAGTRFIDWLNLYCYRYDIDNRLRLSAFLAQVAHESGRFVYVEEIASGAAYEGRASLGNIWKGDGKRFKGRGLMQLTGRTNYEAFREDTGVDVVTEPTLLVEPEYAVWSACWFWKKHKLNELADNADFETITRRINGGLNGQKQREIFYKKCLLFFK